jgi:putative PIN family toxin of toxin-antitoxin system
MVDTNVLVSAIFFESKRLDEVFKTIFHNHTLVISSYTVDELFDVARRKFPARAAVVDALLAQLPYELVYTPKNIVPGLFDIRDPDDYPVLYTAIIEGVDVLITGDKDFADVEIEKPEILTPAQFVEKYAI